MVAPAERLTPEQRAAKLLIEFYDREIAQTIALRDALKKKHGLDKEVPRITLVDLVDQFLHVAKGVQMSVSELVTKIADSDTKPKGKRDVTAVTKCLSENAEARGWKKYELEGNHVAWAKPAPMLSRV